jgi:hypothetical protein
MGWGDAKKSQF